MTYSQTLPKMVLLRGNTDITSKLPMLDLLNHMLFGLWVGCCLLLFFLWPLALCFDYYSMFISININIPSLTLVQYVVFSRICCAREEILLLSSSKVTMDVNFKKSECILLIWCPILLFKGRQGVKNLLRRS